MYIVCISGSIVFYDTSIKSQDGITEASIASNKPRNPGQLVHISKPGEVVSQSHYSNRNVSKARQDARIHIFTAALLEHICALYEPNPEKQRKVLQGTFFSAIVAPNDFFEYVDVWF